MIVCEDEFIVAVSNHEGNWETNTTIDVCTYASGYSLAVVVNNGM